METGSLRPKLLPTKDANIVKIAVEMMGRAPQLIPFDQKQPLTVIIQDLCNLWSLTDVENYALKFNSDSNKKFICEKNRLEVKNGFVLQLDFSAAYVSREILARFALSSSDDRMKAAQQLSSLADDPTFAAEFIEKNGLETIIGLVEGKHAEPIFPFILPAFVDLMEHGIVQWEVISPTFIGRMANLITNQAVPQEPRTLQAALAILECVVLNSNKYGFVEKELTLPNLAMHLQNSSRPTQQNTLALINALFLKADDSKRVAIAGTLNVRQIRNSIVMNIVQSTGTPIGNEMAHQLHVLQTLMLSVLEDKMNKAIDANDADAQEKIKELRRIAFDSDGGGLDPSSFKDVTARKTSPRDFRKLGFRNDANPLLDFGQVPPGSLALDSMVYFARTQMDRYTRVVLENSGRGDDYECPFARAAIELTKLLCEILKIGEAPTEQGTSYHPMLFNHDHPFEELFCVCLVVVNKTWKEMRATVEDFDKVFSVVKEQITRALDSQPASLDTFRTKIGSLTYAEITDLWQQERNTREKWESQSRPIMELREQIAPEIQNLIIQQRLGYLVEGTRFNKYSNRGQRVKEKFWFVRLSPNHRVLHYGDCDEKSVPALDELPNKLPVVDIRALVTGKDCPHMKDARGKKATNQYAFTLILDSNDAEPLNFVAPDQQTFDYWVDGLNALLGNKMNSQEAAHDLEILLAMDIKLRLLDVEGMDLPEEPPPIPAEPTNYDFALEIK